jgi:hypothetical protein
VESVEVLARGPAAASISIASGQDEFYDAKPESRNVYPYHKTASTGIEKSGRFTGAIVVSGGGVRMCA